MKKITLLILSLFVCLLAKPESELPSFTTEESPQWFSIQFKNGGTSVFLSDQGDGRIMKSVVGANSDGEQFQFIGSHTSCKMRSKSGHWVSYSGDRFTTTSSETAAVELMISNGTSTGLYEISRKDSPSMAMNMFGGNGSGKEIGEWNKGGDGNQVYFNATSILTPIFSNDQHEQFYMLKFLVNGNCASLSKHNDDCIRAYTSDPSDKQMWKLVGNKDNFQLINKTGVYAVVSNQSIDTEEGNLNPNPLRASNSPDPKGFSLVLSNNKENGAGFEIKANGRSGNCYLNKWGQEVGFNTIGLYLQGDPNNVIGFVTPGNIIREEYSTTGIEGYTPKNDLTLWYTEPATSAPLYSGGQGYSRWMEYALPIGDGQFGASLFGGVLKDEIQFNEKTLWSGRNTDNSKEYGDYENFGSVYAENLSDAFDFTESGAAKDYYRQLDLTTATGKVSFTDKNGVTYTREYIASHPARVVLAHYTASEDAKISLRFTLMSGKPGVNATTTYNQGEGTFSGKLETVSYNSRIKVVNKGGTIETTSAGIEVHNADEVMLVLAGGTDFDAYSPTYTANTQELDATIRSRVEAAANQSWEILYKEHVEDFQKFYNRVDFHLDGTKNQIPTNELIDNYSNGTGTDALMLEKLYFAYGRYLEIASSRGVHLPSNLQGIWNNMSEPAWNSDIHSNINVQMNYWPAEPTNLSEMHEPFLYYIWNMAENHNEWKNYAKAAGQERGWTCYTENNIFGGVGDFMHNYVIANAWYATHLWQHYRYTLDKEYLKKVFPAMLSASQFWMDRLKMRDGVYVAPYEYSPEHGPKEDGVAHAQQLIAELFSNTLDAINVLGNEDAGISADDLEKLNDRFNKLDKGLATETYNGMWGTANLASGSNILREWKYSSFYSGENGHRHMSHLMCMYPFSQVHPGSELFEAAVNSMKLRGDGATGWSMGWKINLWARALDGNHARTILTNALAHSKGGAGVFYNLFDSHAPFQIDGNFGACAGIAEMIMQSNSDTIRILPALPDAWPQGYINGLKSVKDFTVSIAWKDGKATRITIVNNQGQEIPVLYKHLKDAKIYVDDVETNLSVNDNGVAVLKGDANTTYVFDFEGTYEPTGLQEAENNKLQVLVEGRRAAIVGKGMKRVNVYTMQGHLVMTSTQKSFRINETAGNLLIFEIVGSDNRTTIKKVFIR